MQNQPTATTRPTTSTRSLPLTSTSVLPRRIVQVSPFSFSLIGFGLVVCRGGFPCAHKHQGFKSRAPAQFPPIQNWSPAIMGAGGEGGRGRKPQKPFLSPRPYLGLVWVPSPQPPKVSPCFPLPSRHGHLGNWRHPATRQVTRMATRKAESSRKKTTDHPPPPPPVWWTPRVYFTTSFFLGYWHFRAWLQNRL